MKKLYKCIIVFALLCAVVSQSNAQGGIYMKVAGITGDVTTPAAYANSILLSSYSGGVGRPVTTTSTTTVGTTTVAEITVTMMLNSATLPLLNTVFGKSSAISSVDFYFLNASCSCPYYRVHLENVYLSGFSESSGGDTPAISASLHFDRIAWAYYKANSTTTTNTTGYDIVRGTPFSYSFP